jgi:hypothetical protein
MRPRKGKTSRAKSFFGKLVKMTSFWWWLELLLLLLWLLNVNLIDEISAYVIPPK